MGTTVTASGVSIQLCDPRGENAEDPIFSRFVRVLGEPRTKVIARSGPLMGAEITNPGSDDWLTLIAVADSNEKLLQIVDDSGLPVSEAQTSGSSHRVRVVFDISGRRQTVNGATTIASGPILSLDPVSPKMNVVHIKVIPVNDSMNARHQVEFVAQSRFIDKT